MQFHDIKPGMVIEGGPRLVTEDEIIAFASRYDPQWFHVDPERAARGRWKTLIASGWHTAAISMELMFKHILLGSSSFGSPGLENLRWPAPVRPGDSLSLRCNVLKTGISASGRTGSVVWTWELRNQDGLQVLEVTGTSLFSLHDLPAPGVLSTPQARAGET
jgi:acyl dehydratase